MAKMKHLKAYDRNDCPDHLIQEVDVLMSKMIDALIPVFRESDLPIILSAFNRLHASTIVSMISDKEEELRKATLEEVKALVGNIEDMSGIKVLRDREAPG